MVAGDSCTSYDTCYKRTKTILVPYTKGLPPYGPHLGIQDLGGGELCGVGGCPHGGKAFSLIGVGQVVRH